MPHSSVTCSHYTQKQVDAATGSDRPELAISRDPGANFILKTITKILLLYIEIK
jgi:hypothetical protein